MGLKRAIVADLGEADLLVSDAIARSLTANDQVKYHFALLQTARANADRVFASTCRRCVLTVRCVTPSVTSCPVARVQGAAASRDASF